MTGAAAIPCLRRNTLLRLVRPIGVRGFRGRPCLPVASRAVKAYFYITLVFEFDEGKSHAKREKHGTDFVQPQAIWSDPGLIEIPAVTVDEPRFLLIGRAS